MDSPINNKLNFSFKTNQQILKLISFIDTFKGKWNIIEQKENRYLQQLIKIATIESIVHVMTTQQLETYSLTNYIQTNNENSINNYWQ